MNNRNTCQKGASEEIKQTLSLKLLKEKSLSVINRKIQAAFWHAIYKNHKTGKLFRNKLFVVPLSWRRLLPTSKAIRSSKKILIQYLTVTQDIIKNIHISFIFEKSLSEKLDWCYLLTKLAVFGEFFIFCQNLVKNKERPIWNKKKDVI